METGSAFLVLAVSLIAVVIMANWLWAMICPRMPYRPEIRRRRARVTAQAERHEAGAAPKPRRLEAASASDAEVRKPAQTHNADGRESNVIDLDEWRTRREVETSDPVAKTGADR